MIKLFKLSLVSLIVLSSCSSDSDNAIIPVENQDVATRLHELFDELLPERIVITLIYMGTDLNYDLTTLEDNGNAMVNCQGSVDCFAANLSSQFIQDYTTAHFPATAPELEVNINDNSIWTASYDEGSAIILFQHNTLNIQVEVDAYTGISGGLPMGITPIINGERIEAIGSVLKRRFMQPTEDGGLMTKATINIDGENIIVRFEGGTYGELFAQGGWCEICDINDSEPIFAQASIAINPQNKIEFDMEGLYYFWFEKSDNTTIDIIAEGDTEQYEILPNTYFTSYIPDVTSLFIDKGDRTFDIETISNNLQIQAKEFTYPNLWELDFDHNYKDTGQKSVPTTVIIN